MSNPVQMFQISAVNSATSMTVTPAASPALSGQKYGILVSDNISVDGLAQAMSQLIKEYDENIGAWETFATTSANQSITVTINGTTVTIPGIGKLAQKGSNGALAIADGGTGATTAESARSNLGLRSAATVDLQSSITDTTAGVALMQGAFGLGQSIPNQFSTGIPLDRTQFFGATQGNGSNPVAQRMGGVVLAYAGSSYACVIAAALDTTSPTIWFRGMAGGTAGSWQKFYTSTNTTVASDGTLKAASPVVKLFSDGSFETNDESEGCSVTRLSTGEYLIEGCEGLNSEATWGGIDGGFDIPTDRNKQPLIWLDYEVHADGSVLVKTYHRTHPAAPEFARNELQDISDGDPIDIPSDQFVSVRVQMPQDSIDSIWNQRKALAEIPDSSAS
ncbi:phage tail protein [Enterobacter cloacae]|uniref:phage tail fiber protein n=1 Tax=Enterobacter cloacae TaxID=550 RepID=UPI001EE663A6|nr:phage tail protein [Enterobacter cloacae]